MRAAHAPLTIGERARQDRRSTGTNYPATQQDLPPSLPPAAEPDRRDPAGNGYSEALPRTAHCWHGGCFNCMAGVSRLGLVCVGIDRAAGRNRIEGALATMALADVQTSGYPSDQEITPGDRTLGSPPYYCAIAIGALEKASNAIEGADIAARCKAVATATEAMTSLFLEFDGINQAFSAQGDGRLYETILGRLLRVNLHNNSEMAREAIAMIERLRNSCARWSSAETPSPMTAAYRTEP